MVTADVLVPGNERGGAATHLVTLAKEIDRRGAWGQFTFLIAGEGELYERLRAENAKLVLLSGQPLQLANQIRARRRRLEHEIPILHAHGPRMNLAAYLAVRKKNWTSTIHSDPKLDFLSAGWKNHVLPRVNSFCLRHATGLFVINPALAKAFPKKMTQVVPNSVECKPPAGSRDECRVELRQRLGIDATAQVVGVVARLDAVKDIDTLLRATSRIEGVHVAIAGDGPERESLTELSRTLQMEERVHFLGHITDVQTFYHAIDVHVLPSKSEGTPTVILEAGCASTVSIGSEIPGITQLLTHGKTGLIFPVADDITLSSEIDSLLKNPDQRLRLAREFHDIVLPRFSPSRMFDAYVEGYERFTGVAKQARSGT